MFDRFAAARAQLSAWADIKGAKAENRAQEGIVGEAARSPFIQDKPRFAGAVAAEKAERENLNEERKKLVFKRQACQQGLVQLLRMAATRYREWKQLNDALVLAVQQEAPDTPPSSLAASVFAGPGGRLLEGLTDAEMATLRSLAANLGGLPGQR